MTCEVLHAIAQLGCGGSERQLYCLAEAMKERGWNQRVISFCGDGLWEPHLRKLGIPVYVIPRHRFRPWRLWQLHRYLREVHPSIVHSWSPHVAGYFRYLPWARKIPLIFGIRIDPTVDVLSGQPVPRIRWVKALERAHYAVSNSQQALDNLVSRGVQLPPHAVIPNIVDAPGRARPAEPTNCPRIVGVGSLIPRKAWHVLLAALGMLAAENWSFELCLGGEGSERNALEQLAAKLGLTERVSFLGHVVDVPALLARCHLMVHPSRREGLANAIIEGMAEGLPVIATAEAASEILEDLKTGLLVRADAPRELANAIRRLLVDADFRQRLGQAALAHARRVGGTVAIADAYEKIYLTFATGRIPAGRASAS